MKKPVRGVVKQKNSKLSMFLKGFFAVIFVGFVFVAGLEIGSGNWTVGINKPVTSNKGLPENLDYTSVEEVYDALRRKFDGQLDVEKLMTGMKQGMVSAAGDPYTAYLDAEAAKVFNEQLNGSFSGIGAELGKQGNDIVVISPISGFPAEKAGLKSKDVIVAIDDQEAAGLSVDEAVKRIRGEAGTSVKLGVIRGGTERLDLNIERSVITIPSVEYKVLDSNIGYIKISRYAEDTPGLVQEAATSFKSKGVKGVIVDLRNNPGGYLNGAVKVSNVWLKNGQNILQEKRDGKIVQSFDASGQGTLFGVPTIVLINEGSASASEITAGALKDNNVAKIVGVTSFGKGSVQEFSTFSSGSVLKVTIARWFTPAGKNIDKEGIEPTVKVELTEADVKAGNDTQLNKAIELLKQ